MQVVAKYVISHFALIVSRFVLYASHVMINMNVINVGHSITQNESVSLVRQCLKCAIHVFLPIHLGAMIVCNQTLHIRF